MSAKDQIKQIVDYFKRELYLKDKTDGMAEGLLLGANLADEANERSKDAVETTLAVQEKYKEQILTQDLNPNKDPELVDIRDGSLTAGERIRKFEQETNRQLAEKANEEITNATKFTRSKIAINAYWGDYDDSGNAVWVATKDQIEGQINDFEHLIDELVLVFHLIYYPPENTFRFIESIENLKHGVEYARSRGITTSTLKVHCDAPSSLITSFGEENFWKLYDQRIGELCDSFSVYDIEYFVAFNEQNHLYKASSPYLTRVHNILNNVKARGYKALITPNDIWDFTSLSDSTINILDAISVNLYPKLSNKLDKTTYDDSIAGWNEYVPFFEYLNTFNKPIFVSEFGCIDNWQALNSTGGWSFDSTFTGKGLVQDICYRGFLESDIPQYIDSAWIWFYQSIPNYPQTPQTLKSYRGGTL